MGKKHFTLIKYAERELLCCKTHDETPWPWIPKNWYVPKNFTCCTTMQM